MAGGLPDWVPKVGIVLIILIVLGAWVVGMYNGATSRDTASQQAWADVEVQYQRRFDLIPNLVNTVKGVAGFEQETLTKITELRSQWQTQTTVEGQINTANEFESTLSRLLVIAENYPELKANENFLSLQDELAGTENRISTARTRYNAAAREYNTYIQLIPNSFFVGGRAPKPYFDSTGGAENPPEVPSDFTN